MIKRIFDFVVSLFLLVLLFPLFIFGIVIVFINDGSPIFYKQERVGLDGIVFHLYKFRSMKVDSDRFGTTTYKYDNRVFFGGKLLRRYKIDELPQLINVLRGEMSLVGPRPTVLEDYNKMDKEQKLRNNILPGLTGLAQISGNTNLKWPDRIKCDLYYLEHHNLFIDVKIIFITFFKLVINSVDHDAIDFNEWE